MIPVSFDHSLQVIFTDLLELLISYMLPSRNLFKHKEPQPVAGIQEPFGLRVMGGSHQMDTKVLLQNLCIQLLHGFGHGVSHIRITLMPVQPSQFQLFSIEIESIFFEKRLTESDPHNLLIQKFSFFSQKGHLHEIQLRCLYGPKRYISHLQCMSHLPVLHCSDARAQDLSQASFLLILKELIDKSAFMVS